MKQAIPILILSSDQGLACPSYGFTIQEDRTNLSSKWVLAKILHTARGSGSQTLVYIRINRRLIKIQFTGDPAPRVWNSVGLG